MNAKAGRSLVFARDDGMGALSILSTHLRLFVVFKLHKHIYIYILKVVATEFTFVLFTG